MSQIFLLKCLLNDDDDDDDESRAKKNIYAAKRLISQTSDNYSSKNQPNKKEIFLPRFRRFH